MLPKRFSHSDVLIWPSVISSFYMAGDLKLGQSSLDLVVSFSQIIGYHSEMLLSDLAKVLKPGGVLVVHEPEIKDVQVRQKIIKNPNFDAVYFFL